MIVTATEMPRVMACDGPITLADYKQTDNSAPTDDMMEGNVAHELMRAVLSGSPTARCDDWIGQAVHEGYTVTDSIAEHIQPMVDHIRERSVAVDAEVVCNWQPVVNGPHGIHGRADYIGWDEATATLYIDDLKYGWRIVEPGDNWTLLSHAIAHAVQNNLQPARFVFTILQPRPHHRNGRIRSVTLTFDEVAEAQRAIRKRFEQIDNTMRTGPHCYKCPVAHVCPSASDAALAGLEAAVSGGADILDAATLSAQLELMERASKAIETRLSALRTDAEQRLRDGDALPGWGLEQAQGNRRWKKNVTSETVELFSGVDISVAGLLTPAQAIKRGVPDTVIAQLTERPNRGVKLVRQDIDTKAKELFK